MTTTTHAKSHQTVYIVDGCRTPQLRATSKPGPFRASDLAVACARPLLARQPFDATQLDEVIVGCVMPGADEANIAHQVALRIGCGVQVPAWTVQRNGASGMQAIDSAVQSIVTGHSQLVLAGGTEAMSHTSWLLDEQFTSVLANRDTSNKLMIRLKNLSMLRRRKFEPVMGLIRRLTDTDPSLIMGQTAEQLAYQFNISRQQMDEYALRSHKRLSEAVTQGWLSEVETLFDTAGQFYDVDTSLRDDNSIEKLASLPPAFDPPFGLITKGNSAPHSDGASFLLLASESAVEKYQLKVLGRLVDTQWVALEPAQTGLGPVHATTPLLQRHQLTLHDIDYWEINEVFAAQVLACVAAWRDADYCKQAWQMEKAFGELDDNRLNIDGGGISLGHPTGASGARIVLHLLHILQRKQAQRGVAALCVDGSQGGAMLVERVE